MIRIVAEIRRRFWGNAGAVSRLANRIPILVASGSSDDRDTLRELLHGSRWAPVEAVNWADALAATGSTAFPVILYDRELPGLDWQKGVSMLAQTLRPCCIFLLSDVADQYLWDELVRCGGFDLLARPFRRDEVVAALDFAHLYWKSAILGRRAAS